MSMLSTPGSKSTSALEDMLNRMGQRDLDVVRYRVVEQQKTHRRRSNQISLNQTRCEDFLKTPPFYLKVLKGKDTQDHMYM